MKIGFDYWHVISHYPDEFKRLAESYLQAGHEVHVVSGIGTDRIGTIEDEVRLTGVPFTAVHEVVFDRPSQSPTVKTLRARELGLSIFYDDRQDVCDEMTASGILAFRVPRRSYPQLDLQSERE